MKSPWVNQNPAATAEVWPKKKKVFASSLVKLAPLPTGKKMATKVYPGLIPPHAGNLSSGSLYVRVKQPIVRHKQPVRTLSPILLHQNHRAFRAVVIAQAVYVLISSSLPLLLKGNERSYFWHPDQV